MKRDVAWASNVLRARYHLHQAVPARDLNRAATIIRTTATRQPVAS